LCLSRKVAIEVVDEDEVGDVAAEVVAVEEEGRKRLTRSRNSAGDIS
jgi:hypothetical protein